MSERKSAEIKFRCTPTFKAGVQAAAEAAAVSMSEYIESAVWSHQNMNTRIVDMAAARSILDGSVKITPGFAEVISTNTDVCVPLTHEDEPPVDDDPATWCLCRPWEFCTHKATG